MTHRLPRILLAAALLLVAGAAAEVGIPQLRAHVTDLTSTLTAEQRATLGQKLAAFETRKGSQIGVLVVPTTQPEAVEQYAVRVQEAWKLGRKGIDDGVLMVVAKDDRRLWIEVGYGLEGALPDATTKRIIDEEIVPRFKQGNYFGGISAGVDRIMRVIDGEPLPPPVAGSSSERGPDLKKFLVIGLILVFVVGSYLRAVFGRFLGSSVLGFATGLITWLVVGSLLIGILFGIAVLVVSLFGGARHGGWIGGYPGGGWSPRGGWSSGGGGWSGGGGMSGGGGRSGGGGAGGSW